MGISEPSLLSLPGAEDLGQVKDNHIHPFPVLPFCHNCLLNTEI